MNTTRTISISAVRQPTVAKNLGYGIPFLGSNPNASDPKTADGAGDQ